MDTTASTTTTADRRSDRRAGYRMTCAPCQVAWTGDRSEPCWVCGLAGTTGPEPTLYPASAG